MDPIEIEGPDGAVNEFPAGTPDDVIEKAMRAQYGGPEATPEPEAPKQGSMVDDFVRGVDRIAGTQFSGAKQRPVSLNEYGQEAENVVRAMTAPLGGDYLAAAGSAVAGKGYNPDEQRARREELADRNAGSKTAAVAGELLGAGAVGKVLAPAGGGVLARGATTGAVTGANLSGGDLVETAKGAALGAAGGKVAEKLGEAFSPLMALAKRLKTDAQTLGTEFKTLEAALGRKPTMVELMSENQTKAMTKLAEGRGGRTMETFQDAQRADLAARPGRMAANVEAGGPTNTVGAVVGREEADLAARTAARELETATAVADEAAGARTRLSANKQRTQDEVAQQNQVAEDARNQIRTEISRATDADGVAGVDRAKLVRDEWANETMGALEQTPILFGRETVQNQLQNRNVVTALQRMAGAAPNRGAENAILGKVDKITSGEAVYLTARELDSVRRTLNAAAEADPALKTGLRNITDTLEARARKALPAYRKFLDDYASMSQEIEGIQHGLGAMAPGGATAFGQKLVDESAAFRAGAEGGARAAVRDAATRAPENTARSIAADPRKVSSALGGRGQDVVRAAVQGANTIDEAMAAARAAGLRGQDAAQAIREAYKAARGRLETAGKDAVSFLKTDTGARTGAVQRAAKVLTDDTAEFQQALRNAPNADDVAAVARGRIASTAGESEPAALRTARTLASPGGRARTATALGPEESGRLATAAEGELRGAENLAAITRREAKDVVGSEELNALVDVGAMAATGAKSAGVASRVTKGIVGKLGALGMAPGVGRKIAELATSPDGVEKVIQFLRKSNVSDRAIERIGQAIGSVLGS